MWSNRTKLNSPSRRAFIKQSLMAGGLAAASHKAGAAKEKARPNILWITTEDHGQQLGCYGDPLARTPNIDTMAAAGVRYEDWIKFTLPLYLALIALGAVSIAIAIAIGLQ